MREEPLAYINGSPYAPRNPGSSHQSIYNQATNPNPAPETPHSNLMEKLDGEQVAKVNLHLAKVLRRRQKESGNSSIKIHQDKEYSENPMERVDVEETLTVQEDGIKVASKLIIIIYNLLSHIPIKTCNANFRTWRVCTPPVVRNAMLSSRWVADYSHVFTYIHIYSHPNLPDLVGLPLVRSKI